VTKYPLFFRTASVLQPMTKQAWVLKSRKDTKAAMPYT